MRPTLIASALVVTASFGIPAHGQQPTASTCGAVTGTVKVDGKPAAGVTVMLVESTFQRDKRPAGTARVDKEGAFRIDEVPSGKYRIVVDAPALVADGNLDFEGKGVLVEAGATVKDVDLTLRRGGVITGRITNKDGAPLVRMNVSVYRIDEDGKPNEVSTFSRDDWMNQTDDRGTYRLYGLLPGSYIVAAGLANDGSAFAFGPAGKRFNRQYFPGVATDGEARRLDVSAGGESTGVDFVLTERSSTFTVSGRIVDGDTGEPLKNIAAGFGPAVNGKLTTGLGVGSMTDAKGAFSLTGFAPGTYGITGIVDGYFVNPTIVDVSSADVSGVEVQMHRGGSISGVLALENASADQSESLKQLALVARPAPSVDGVELEYAIGDAGYAQVTSDGMFQIAGLKSGSYLIDAARSSNSASTPTLLRIERDGNRIDGPIEVSAGETVENIRVVFALGTGIIRGRVKFEGSLPTKRYTVIEMRTPDATRPARSEGVEEDNQYAIDKLPPGDYVVQAITRFYDPASPGLAPIRSEEQHVTITESSRAEVNFVIRVKAGGGDPK